MLKMENKKDAKEIIKRVKKIEIKTRHLVEGLLQGAYHSIFKGRGIEFSEVRPYQIGDDVRAIDWNVTARFNEPFIKEFIEERYLTIYIIFDVSASGEFGNLKEKKDMAIELSSSIMFAALRNNDKVGLVLFSEGVEKFIPARKGRKHVLKLIREMIYFVPKSKKTDINSSLSYVASIIKKKSIMFLISDFLSEGFNKPLKILKQKHDIILVNINDPRELEMPDVGYIELEDEETGEQMLVNTSDENFRNHYKSLIKNRYNTFKKTLQKLNIDLIQLHTEESFEIPLRKFFKLRMRRVL
jgi:uncharacterized protein (DUF58 family)